MALTGGLGNQLFQIATGISLTDGQVTVLSCLGNPRGTLGTADAAQLQLPARVEYHKCRKKHVLSKTMFSFLISMSTKRNHLNRSLVFRVMIYAVAGIILTLHTSRLIFPRVGNGTGYDETLESKRGNLLVGYFQTYLYMERATNPNEMRDIEIKMNSTYILELQSKMTTVEINMIHMRIGDYKNEKNFGILGSVYYESALRLLPISKTDSKTWLFSDEPMLAIEKLSAEVKQSIYVVKTKGVSAAETLELMKYCKNFVIANSSLSWWGAFLSKHSDKKIVAPLPWFENTTSPNSLVPREWTLLDRNG